MAVAMGAISMSLSHILKGIGGESEIGRTLLTFGAAAVIITPVVFECWHLANGGKFNVTEWCLAYPGGIAALLTSGILSIGGKDRFVATARVTAKGTDDATGKAGDPINIKEV